jgi:hypothetical protein
MLNTILFNNMKNNIFKKMDYAEQTDFDSKSSISTKLTEKSAKTNESNI